MEKEQIEQIELENQKTEEIDLGEALGTLITIMLAAALGFCTILMPLAIMYRMI